MRHPFRWLFAGLAVVVLAIGGFVAWYVFADDAPAKPTLSDDATVDEGAQTAAGSWVLAPGDDVYVGYRIKELFAGAALKKDAVGRTPEVKGSITIAGDAVEKASVTADLRELKSNRFPRDNYIHSNGIESDTYPNARFVLTGPVALPTDLEPGEKAPLTLDGRLTLHGVTKPVSVDVDARWNGATIEVAGTAPIDLADYDIDPPETAVVAVDDHGSLELKLVFRRSR